MVRLSVFALTLFIALPLWASAQITTGLVSSGPSLDLLPPHPEPNEPVVVRLNDYASNVGGGTIRWYVDGQEYVDQVNQRQITVMAGGSGKDQIIRARVTPPDGLPLDIERTIKPYYLDLIIEPQTRVPAQYTGRALPSIGSQVNATAILSANKAPESLTYSWRINDSVLYNGPVLGQNRVSFTMPQGSAIVSVSVSDGSGVLASQSIELLNTEPLLRFYSFNPLYGVNRLPISERFILLGSNATVRAEPYYLDLKTYNTPDLLEWTVDGGVAGTRGQNPYDLTLARTGGGTVGFHVRNLTQVLQGSRGGFMVE